MFTKIKGYRATEKMNQISQLTYISCFPLVADLLLKAWRVHKKGFGACSIRTTNSSFQVSFGLFVSVVFLGNVLPSSDKLRS